MSRVGAIVPLSKDARLKLADTTGSVATGSPSARDRCTPSSDSSSAWVPRSMLKCPPDTAIFTPAAAEDLTEDLLNIGRQLVESYGAQHQAPQACREEEDQRCHERSRP